MPLIVVGLSLGVAADWLLRVPAVPALNLFVWLTLIAAAAAASQRHRNAEGGGRKDG